MNYLLDTNILLSYIRGQKFAKDLEDRLDLLKPENTLMTSVVCLGEIKSIAFRNKWGKAKWRAIENLINKLLVLDIHTEEIVDKYAEIDAFSQGKHPNLLLSTSSRNMGKNDIWIAATAAVYELILLTTDQDFSHLGNTFLQLQEVQIS